MSAFASILDKSGALLLLLAALFIVMGQMAVLLLFVQEKRSRRQTAAATVHLLTGFLLFVFLLDSYDIVNYPQTQGASIRSEGILFRLPWLCYVCLEAFFAASLSASLACLMAFSVLTFEPRRPEILSSLCNSSGFL